MNKLFAARLKVVSYSCKKLRRSQRGTKKKAIPAKMEQATAWALKTWQAWAIQCLPSDDSNEGPEITK